MPCEVGGAVRTQIRAVTSPREKDAGSRCVISMNGSTTSIHDPRNPSHVKTFTFDLAYWSHSGFIKDEEGKFISAAEVEAECTEKTLTFPGG
uniref:Uncharacterized protein n=1 Tax=Salvator merianae TaxID=96440 RepID=A0A8D0BU18_SALMN